MNNNKHSVASCAWDNARTCFIFKFTGLDVISASTTLLSVSALRFNLMRQKPFLKKYILLDYKRLDYPSGSLN